MITVENPTSRYGTVTLLSSHLVHEIEVVADNLVVIGHGRIVAAGPKEDLLGGTGSQVPPAGRCGALTGVSVDEGEGHVCGGQRVGELLVVAALATFRVDADAEAIGRVAHDARIPLIELRSADGARLEEMFLELTADTERQAHPDTHRPGSVS